MFNIHILCISLGCLVELSCLIDTLYMYVSIGLCRPDPRGTQYVRRQYDHSRGGPVLPHTWSELRTDVKVLRADVIPATARHATIYRPISLSPWK